MTGSGASGSTGGGAGAATGGRTGIRSVTMADGGGDAGRAGATGSAGTMPSSMTSGGTAAGTGEAGRDILRVPSPGCGAWCASGRWLVYACAWGARVCSPCVAQPSFFTQHAGWCSTAQPSQRRTASPSVKGRSQSGQKRWICGFK